MITLEGKIHTAKDGIIIVCAPFDNDVYLAQKDIRPVP